MGTSPKSSKIRKSTTIIILVVLGVAIGWVNFLRTPDEFISPPLQLNTNEAITLLTINVGNSNLFCSPYLWKLCWSDVEERIASNLKSLKPDIVAIQEILPDWLCSDKPSIFPDHVCYRNMVFSANTQVRRLLGEDYTIVCEIQYGFECLAIRKELGQINTCPSGSTCKSNRSTETLEGCDAGFTTLAATITLNGRSFDVVNAHPQSSNAECRSFSLEQVFESIRYKSGIIESEDVIVLGDFNLDPWLQDDQSVSLWMDHVGKDQLLQHLSSVPDQETHSPTFFLFTFRLTLDHVLSNFGRGSCLVLGESEGTSRIDGGWGNDHRAVYCEFIP